MNLHRVCSTHSVLELATKCRYFRSISTATAAAKRHQHSRQNEAKFAERHGSSGWGGLLSCAMRGEKQSIARGIKLPSMLAHDNLICSNQLKTSSLVEQQKKYRTKTHTCIVFFSGKCTYIVYRVYCTCTCIFTCTCTCI